MKCAAKQFHIGISTAAYVITNIQGHESKPEQTLASHCRLVSTDREGDTTRYESKKKGYIQ